MSESLEVKNQKNKMQAINNFSYGPSLVWNYPWTYSRYQETVKLAYKKSLLYKVLCFFVIGLALLFVKQFIEATISESFTAQNLIISSFIVIVLIFQRIHRHRITARLSEEEVKLVNEKIITKVELIRKSSLYKDLKINDILRLVFLVLLICVISLILTEF